MNCKPGVIESILMQLQHKARDARGRTRTSPALAHPRAPYRRSHCTARRLPAARPLHLHTLARALVARGTKRPDLPEGARGGRAAASTVAAVADS